MEFPVLSAKWDDVRGVARRVRAIHVGGLLSWGKGRWVHPSGGLLPPSFKVTGSELDGWDPLREVTDSDTLTRDPALG